MSGERGAAAVDPDQCRTPPEARGSFWNREGFL